MTTTYYPHPLDYVTGQKHTVTSEKLSTTFAISPETFYVEELVNFNELGFTRESGEYAVMKITKKYVDTLRAIRVVSRKLNIPLSNILIMGLKDKNAFTVSYFFVKSTFISKADFPVIDKNMYVELLGFTKKKPTRKHHLGNLFKLKLGALSNKDLNVLEKVAKVAAEHGLISYYGYQRFGYSRYNTHILGKYLLLGREDLFAHYFLKAAYPLEGFDIMFRRFLSKYSSLWYEDAYVDALLSHGLKVVVRATRRMFIDAYASYLFNLLLNNLVDKYGLEVLSNRVLPLPGCEDGIEYYREIVEHEGLNISVLKYMPCSKRPALFKVKNSAILKSNGNVIYEFILDSGMFATVVLRELFKENLVIPGQSN